MIVKYHSMVISNSYKTKTPSKITIIGKMVKYFCYTQNDRYCTYSLCEIHHISMKLYLTEFKLFT